ncbi:MAG: hypothetical protein REI11_21330, partial [Patulibacter sp.]|nr:hypothetical protein [Patulibacter sp.]
MFKVDLPVPNGQCQVVEPGCAREPASIVGIVEGRDVLALEPLRCRWKSGAHDLGAHCLGVEG